MAAVNSLPGKFRNAGYSAIYSETSIKNTNHRDPVLSMTDVSKTTPLYKLFENRREFPRLVMNIPAIITGQDGSPIKSTLYDLSPGGTQMRYLIADGMNLFPVKELSNKNLSDKEVKSLKCLLQFRLQLRDRIRMINIHAYLVHLRPVDKETLAAGMIFDMDDRAEKQLIKEFLYLQLEKSFTPDVFLTTKTAEKTMENRPEAEPSKAEIISTSGAVADKTKEPGYSKTEMAYLKQELIRIQSSLKVIQETTRHIDERIYQLEQLLARKN